MHNNNKLKYKIITKAGKLFSKQGFRATSIKQIAKAAGCTNAALYYYFEKGKSQLLKEVIQSKVMNPASIRQVLNDSRDFNELIGKFNELMVLRMPTIADELFWLTMEFPRLPKEDKEAIQNQNITNHGYFKSEIGRFVVDEVDAGNLAWLMLCAYLGYYQVFIKEELGPSVGLDIQQFGTFLTKVLSKYVEAT